MAGNHVGKSYAGAMEVAIHATGRYPEWWKGYRFDRPVRAWCCGESNEVVRESLQKLLLGEAGAFVTGNIPKDALLDVVPSRSTVLSRAEARRTLSTGPGRSARGRGGRARYSQSRIRRAANASRARLLISRTAMKNRRRMCFTKS